MAIIPNLENLTEDSPEKLIYHYYDSYSKPIYKTKELNKINGTITFYPYNLNRATGQIKPKKISVIEFKGWKNISDLPKDFRRTPGYGFSSLKSKQLLSVLYKKFPELNKLSISVNGKNRFSKKSISFDWGTFDQILKQLGREKFQYDRNRKILANNLLSKYSDKIQPIERHLNAGELEQYLNKFDSYEKISVRDIDSLTGILSDLPTSKITTTAHIIKTKEKIDLIYLEDIITNFETLIKSGEDNEEAWQKFFEAHTWTLNHLFPYEVILNSGKAYVGGKTIENTGARIVDFLFANGFKDNYALLEIKTHKKSLLKNSAYREPSVFPVSDELSGGINQCLDQKDLLMRELGQKYKALDPKTILVIGQKKKLTSEQSSCFELFRANQKNVDIVTFDELHAKLIGLYEVITGNKRK